jgi:hypothetical protein
MCGQAAAVAGGFADVRKGDARKAISRDQRRCRIEQAPLRFVATLGLRPSLGFENWHLERSIFYLSANK